MRRTVVVVLALTLASHGQKPVSSRTAQADAVFREATSLLSQITDVSERDYVVSELAQAEERAGFSSEALSTAALRSKDGDLLLADIGNIQVARGQYESALATVAGQDRIIQDEVREKIGVEQARRGEVQLALQTAASMLDGYDKESVLYFVALELLRQGQTSRAKEIAANFTAPDHQLPDESSVGPNFDWRKPVPPPPPLSASPQTKHFYTNAVAQLRLGNVSKAISIIEADDNPADVSSNFSRLATEAAALGNLDVALQLSARAHVSGAGYKDYYSETLPPIGRLWGTRNATAATRWARDMRTSAQRALALAGVAEGIATGS